MEPNKVDATKTSDEGKTPPSPEGKEGRSETDKAAYNLKKKAEEAKALGLDPLKVLGISNQVEVDDEMPDDTPLTVGTLRDFNKKGARKDAEQMAGALSDENERERVLSELKYIVPSGDAQADFRRAQAAANIEHNTQVAEELARKGQPKRTAAGGSANATPMDTSELTPQEMIFTRRPYNLSKEKIIAARPK